MQPVFNLTAGVFARLNMQDFSENEPSRKHKYLWKYVVIPVAAGGLLILAAIVAPLILDMVFPSTITVANESGMALRNVEIFGQGGSLQPADLPSGQARSARFHLAGTSDMGLRFTSPDGESHERWFFVAGILPREIDVRIGSDLKIRRQEGRP